MRIKLMLAFKWNSCNVKPDWSE